MLDPTEIYDLDPQTAEQVTAAGDRGPVMVQAMRGFVDAGGTGQVAAAHLVDELDTRRLVTFDVDQLFDYRSRRPTLTFDSSTWTGYDRPELAIELAHDAKGVAFLLLHGTEPDLQWERWAGAVRQIVERFDVPLTVGLHGIPMGVPHTRPLGATAHANRAELVSDHPAWMGTVQVPASAGEFLEMRLGESGHDAMGFAVHVPHYLAQSTFPQASVVGLGQVERATGLDLRVGLLEPAAHEAVSEVERQVHGSVEVAAVVHALEEQYDAFMANLGRRSLLTDPSSLPTADELGDELERFLAEQGGAAD